MTSAKTRQLPFAIAFGILSFLTVALGALTLQQAGLSAGLWLRNPVAWLVGGGLSLGLSRVIRPSVALVWPALILLGLCFVFPGQDGVHRWLALGPVQLNAAALILPLVLTATRTERPSSMWLIGLGLITACLAWQPDRSQLLAFSVAALVLIAQTYGARAAVGHACGGTGPCPVSMAARPSDARGACRRGHTHGRRTVTTSHRRLEWRFGPHGPKPSVALA